MVNGGGVLDAVWQVRKFAELEPVCIDGFVFRLHYWATSTALFFAALIAFAKQYFGDPIECIFDSKQGTEMKAVDAYCWLHSTTHLDPELIRKLNVLSQRKYACQMEQLSESSSSMSEETFDTLYYQWVPFFLAFQAMVFRVSWQLWKWLEGGKMSDFGLQGKRHVHGHFHTDDEWQQLANQLAAMFRTTLHRNTLYYCHYVACETLSLLLLLAVLDATDTFLDEQFMAYGRRVLDYYFYHSNIRRGSMHIDDTFDHTPRNPMCSLFPTVTSCQFPSGAVTGSLNVDHALCVLSLNIINEKIFLLEWFWFITLTMLSALASLSTMLTLLCPAYRRLLLRLRLRSSRPVDLCALSEVLRHCYVGDWFLLTLIAKNTTVHVFRRVLVATAEQMREAEHNEQDDKSEGNGSSVKLRHTRRRSQWRTTTIESADIEVRRPPPV